MVATAALAGHDALLPRAPGGHGAGAVLALLVHLGLIAALTTAVDWRSKTPEAVSAELWAAVPQTAAPRAEAPAPTPAPAPAPTPAPAPPPALPVPAPPPVPAPDIATGRAAQRKAEAERVRLAADEQKKAAAEASRLRDQQARDAKAEDVRLARLREDNLKRMMGAAAQATGRSGAAAHDAAPSAAYAGRLAAVIRRGLVFTGTVEANPAAEVEVKAGPSGTIISRRLVKSSGSKEWDDAVLRAIDKVRALPPDTDGRVPQVLTISFKPNE